MHKIIAKTLAIKIQFIYTLAYHYKWNAISEWITIIICDSNYCKILLKSDAISYVTFIG